MEVSLSTAPPATNVARAAAGKGLDGETFMRLMLEQMKHQDPLNPANSQDIMMQMASVSSLQQAVAQNEKLDDILSASSLQDGVMLVGRQVRLQDGETAAVTGLESAGQSFRMVLNNGRVADLSELSDGFRDGARCRRPDQGVFLDRSGDKCAGDCRDGLCRDSHRRPSSTDADSGNDAHVCLEAIRACWRVSARRYLVLGHIRRFCALDVPARCDRSRPLSEADHA
jgi:flagellar basal-body rod modification protein FlgD